MKKYLVGLALAASVALPAQASITLSTTPGDANYNGPTPFEDFDTASYLAFWTGGVFTNNIGGVRAQPLGSTGGYASVGPTDGTPGDFDLTSFDKVASISFIWGSVDTYNTLEIFDAADNLMASFTGSDVFNPANGDQGNANTNPIVTIRFNTLEARSNVAYLRFNSTQNAFEFDNLAVAVPEPATWAMMIGGFGMLGAAVRRSRKSAAVYA